MYIYIYTYLSLQNHVCLLASWIALAITREQSNSTDREHLWRSVNFNRLISLITVTCLSSMPKALLYDRVDYR